ncbi:MAG: 30S ribosomal protein S18 [Patescibacteria group bacterium]|nr:30S ribosomal protein S18 [Patescibacteria group bacterium]
MPTELRLPPNPYFDYKDIEVLKRFLNPYGKILSRRRTRLSAAGQRSLAQAVKRARYMALLPYVIR